MAGTPVSAKPKGYRFSNLYGKRQIIFYSKAPMESFEGVVGEVNGSLMVDFSKRNLGLKGTITIPVMSMQTGITLRDVHMRGNYWLRENRYPTIKLELDAPKYQLAKKKGKNKWYIETQGRFTLKGLTKTIDVPVTLTRKKDKKGNYIVIKGGFPINIKDHGIHGPLAMKMIGVKVSPIIKISLKLVAREMEGWGKPKKKSGW